MNTITLSGRASKIFMMIDIGLDIFTQTCIENLQILLVVPN